MSDYARNIKYKFKGDISPMCDAIVGSLSKKHPLIKWRYFLNHIVAGDDRTPVESVDFRGTANICGIDWSVKQCVTSEMLEMSMYPVDEMIAYHAEISFANFIMSDGK